MIKAKPHEFVNPQGDCGACCIASIVGNNIKDVYDAIGGVKGLTYFDLCKALDEFEMEYNTELPFLDQWRQESWYQILGMPSFIMVEEFFRFAKMRLLDGYVGIAPINYHGKLLDDESIDHFVLITSIDCSFESKDVLRDVEVKISCPSKGDYWISIKPFLKYYGGWNTIWVKPEKY